DPDPVKLDGWEAYTSPDNVFKASFPGQTKGMDISLKNAQGSVLKDVKASEFRVYWVQDEKSGGVRTYFAGFVRFTQKPTQSEVKGVTDSLRWEALGSTGTSSLRRVSLGGWPWAVEEKRRPDASGSGTNGILRYVQAGSTIYAAGMKSTARFPSDKEIDKFFGSFEILDATPETKDLDFPPDWAEYRSPGGEFQAIMPRSVLRSEDPMSLGKQYGKMP